MSEYETEVTEGVFPLGGVNDALAQYFSGTSYMNTLVNDPDVPVTVANVSFEPGVRNGAKALTRNHDRLIASHIVVAVGAVEWLEPVDDIVYTEIHSRIKNGTS